MQKNDSVLYKWIFPIALGLFIPLCSVVYGFVVRDISNNTRKIELVEKNMRTGEIIQRIDGLEKLFNTKIDALKDVMKK